jgi:hypothetical protein
MSSIDNNTTKYFNYLGPRESFINLAYDNMYEIIKEYKNNEFDDTADDILDIYLHSIQSLINDINNDSRLSNDFKECFNQEAKKEMTDLSIFRSYINAIT